MSIKQSISMATIKAGRKLFYNTPVQRWPLTSYVYDRVFHSGYAEKELRTNYFGVDLLFPGRDFTITPGLVGGFYEKYELELFSQLCKASTRVVDVGGNIGLYSAIAGKAGCDVTVFEPVPENQEYLQKNIVNNGLSKKVELVKKAVGSEEGQAKIYLSEKNIGTHSLSSKAAQSDKYLTVDVVTLDKTLKNMSVLDILKVDVEGYDGYVLEGCKNVLSRLRPTLFVELVPSHLEGAGYNPVDFVKLITKQYATVYLVDEVRETCKVTSPESLERFAATGKSANLIAVSNDDHKRILDKIGGRKQVEAKRANDWSQVIDTPQSSAQTSDAR